MLGGRKELAVILQDLCMTYEIIVVFETKVVDGTKPSENCFVSPRIEERIRNAELILICLLQVASLN